MIIFSKFLFLFPLIIDIRIHIYIFIILSDHGKSVEFFEIKFFEAREY